jgi:hypothetical protein
MRYPLLGVIVGAALLLWGCGGAPEPVQPGPTMTRAAAWTRQPSAERPGVPVPEFWNYTLGTDDGAIFCTGWCTEERCAVDCVDLTDDAAVVAFDDPSDITPPPPMPPEPRGPTP